MGKVSRKSIILQKMKLLDTADPSVLVGEDGSHRTYTRGGEPEAQCCEILSMPRKKLSRDLLWELRRDCQGLT